MHPYCHAQSESDCGWSFVRAVVESSDELDINLNGKLFISGYSQGGHVAMAMAMNDPPVSIQDDIELTAVAPLSGPYDLSGIQLPRHFKKYHIVTLHTCFIYSRVGILFMEIFILHSQKCVMSLMHRL